jgi:hypothetical protein
MTRRTVVTIVIYALPTIGLLLQGLLYLTTSTFMPYHAEALATTWEELPPNYQGFLLGVIRAMGAGSFTVALVLLILLAIPFRNGDRWACWTVPLIGVVFTLLIAYAAYTIDVLTPAATPWRSTCGLTMLYLLGGIISNWPKRPV